MQKLFTRFAVIFVVLILGLWASLAIEPKKGIDLAGGVDLLYELDIAKNVSSHESRELAGKVIETLKRRVDPYGQKNLTWRVVGDNRIQIQMPLASQKTRAAREVYRNAEDKLAATNIGIPEVISALQRPADQRKAALDQLLAPSDPRRPLLDEFAAKWVARQAALAELSRTPFEKWGLAESDLDTKTDSELKKAQQNLLASNVDIAKLTGLIEAAENPNNQSAKKELDDLVATYPNQKTLVGELVAAGRELFSQSSGGYDDPAELMRLLRGSGVLDFRIALENTAEHAALAAAAKESLQLQGPRRPAGPDLQWFEIDPVNGAELLKQPYYVQSEYGGRSYILLYTDTDHSLTHQPPRDNWKLTKAGVNNDPNTGKLVVEFKFDDMGAQYLGTLTSMNKGRPMAILLDDKTITAPNIQNAITTGSGIITFGSATAARPYETIRKEAEMLVRMLEAGSLPATLQPEPISVQTISSSFGEDNIRAGLQSGVYAVIAVMIFMALYYSVTGWFANVALLINLVLITATMAMMGASYTLPGIAGIVLTLGMAVDANVLINERIREEIHQGKSMQLAVKLGYDRVFWTIFDANLTTSLTAIVLVWLGSEEVKGFGITLLIGLTIHMFTALFVTRTFMSAAVRWGVMKEINCDPSMAEYVKEIVTGTWLKGKWPFLHMIKVPNIDWIGKRHYFWTFSLVISIAGLVAFIARGDDKYDTEFNGGTQVTFQLKPGASLDISDVRKRVWSLSSIPGLEDAKDATVQELMVKAGEPQRFTVVTAIADTAEKKIKSKYVEVLAEKFSDVLNVRPKLAFKSSDVGLTDRDVTSLIEKGIIRPINKPSIEQLLPGSAAADPRRSDLSAYQGGAAILLDNITPASTESALVDRLRSTRSAPDFKDVRNRPYELIPLAYAAPAASQPAGTEKEVTKAVLIVRDDNISYMDNAESWQSILAMQEWRVVNAALTSPPTLDGVTSFDAAVAQSAKIYALISILISLVMIVIYVWIRFGSLRYGMGAILSLAHDGLIAVAGTVLAGELVKHAKPLADALLISDFKINMTMIAAYLTVIGYSVNDTIVIFDRVRENRGRLNQPLTKQLVNDSINQCFGRTIWTSFTVLVVLFIMYIWGGEGVRGFSFAMLVGALTGVYSTLAIASPMLLSVAEKKAHQAAEQQSQITGLANKE